MRRARIFCGLPDKQEMTANQALIYRNHNGSTNKYCLISIFGLRPPELLGVFRNPVDYYRCCRIDEKNILSDSKVADMLSEEIWSCKWVDCLGRRVKIRKRAFGEVRAMVKKNLSDLNQSEDSSRKQFDIAMNAMIMEMVASSEPSETDEESGGWGCDELVEFVDFNDSDKHLPIPVTTNSTPFNPHLFLTHIVLSLGKYDTGIDALTHGSYRESFRASGLIGNSDKMQDLQEYSRRLTRRYVLEQVVFYPVSVTRAEAVIVCGSKKSVR